MNTADQKVIVYGEPRHAWLDWLRAVSILMVLATHYQVDWHDAGLFKPLAMFFMRVGWAGVDFFFIISGFLIGNLLLGEVIRYGKLDAKRFYVRRLLKIWPLYYLVCVIYIIISPWLFDQTFGTGLHRIAPALIHIQNYIKPSAMGHLWSLAVEEHFYVLLPILIVLCHRLSSPQTFTRNLGLTIAAGILIVIALRIYTVVAFGLTSGQIRSFSHVRIDSLFLGVLLAWTYRFKPVLWQAVQRAPMVLLVPFLLGLVTFAFNPNHSQFVGAAGFTLIAISFGAALVFVSRYETIVPHKVTEAPLRVAAWIGRYSYPIYLFHPFLWIIMGDKLGYPAIVAQSGGIARSCLWLAGLLAFVAMSIGLGAVVGILLEKPLLALRNRLVPARTLVFDQG